MKLRDHHLWAGDESIKRLGFLTKYPNTEKRLNEKDIEEPKTPDVVDKTAE